MTRIPSPPRPAPTSLPDVAWTRSSPPPVGAPQSIRRQPEPPKGLDKLERRAFGYDAPEIMADRALIRAMPRYVRRLDVKSSPHRRDGA